MVQRGIEFVLGLLFGLGLLVSSMTDPGKVLGFLDVLGAWDPSLALVMGGAVGVGLLGYAWARRLPQSWCGQPLHWPQAREVDRPLVLGSLLFGVGWGLAGFCPGPAWVAAAAGQPSALIFVAAMLAGMAIHDRSIQRRSEPKPE